MLDVIQLLNNELLERLSQGFRQQFGRGALAHEQVLLKHAERIVQTIAESNTLYHNVEHTVQVTLVGQTILQGRVLDGHEITPKLWTNFILALLCHDIGYVAGISGSRQAIRSPDASDAVLMPVHIDRGKQYVFEQLAKEPGVDVQFIQECIERTRFPVPNAAGYQRTDDYPGLVRGADLVGQLSDPRYLNKLPAMFFEFEESGYNTVTGFQQPGDLMRNYADFYAESVQPFVGETLHYLSLTEEGKQVIANLQANIALAKATTHRF